MNFFLKNLCVWLIGMGCMVLAALFPAWSAFGPIGGILLSAAQMGAALNGSFAKHLIVFALGMACNALSIALKSPAASAALIPAGGMLMQMSNLAKILQGMGLQGAGAVVAGKPPVKSAVSDEAARAVLTDVLKGVAPPKGDDEITADERPPKR